MAQNSKITAVPENKTSPSHQRINEKTIQSWVGTDNPKEALDNSLDTPVNPNDLKKG